MKVLPALIILYFVSYSHSHAQDISNADSLNLTDLSAKSANVPNVNNITFSNLYTFGLIDNDMITQLPVRGLTDYMLLLPGVQSRDGELSIRGGPHDGIGYFVGGSMVGNSVTGGTPVYIIPEALSEMRVFGGGQSARYGLATSGMVFSDLKQGQKGFHIGLNMQTDKLAGEGEKFLGTYAYQDQILVGTLSGTTWEDKFRFFVAAENLQSGDWVKRFSSGFSFNGLVDTNPRTVAVHEGTPDTVSVSYPDGFTPDNSLDHLALNTRMDFTLDRFHINVTGLYLDQKIYESDIPMLDMLNSRKYYFEHQNLFVTGKISHQVSESFDYTVGGAYYQNKRERFDDYFGNKWQAWSDSALISQHTGGAVTYRSRWRAPYDYLLLGIPFKRNGARVRPYVKENQEFQSVEGSVNVNIFKDHNIIAGFFWMESVARYYEISPLVMGAWEEYDFSPDVPVPLFYQYVGQIYGYDMFGNEISDGLHAPKKQSIFSMYIEDYFTLGRIDFQLGLRMDYLKDNRLYLRNPSNPIIDEGTLIIADSEWIEEPGQWHISPRIGVKYEINESFSANLYYTQFVQSSLNISPGLTEPLISKITEAGIVYNHDLFDLNLIGFKKDLNFYPYLAEASTYYISDHSGSANTSGLELSFKLKRVRHLSALLNYTYMIGDGVYETVPVYYGAVYRGSEIPATTSPLQYISKHKGVLMIDYRYGPGEGGSILERSGVNLAFDFQSGHPYTRVYAPPGGQSDWYSAGVDYMNDPRSREALEDLNSSTTPWNYYLHLRLDKTFDLFKTVRTTVFIRVLNLLNTKNVVNVYPSTGQPDDDGYISDPQRYATAVSIYGPQYLDLYRAVNIENSQSYWDQSGRQMYGQPRQIFFGIELVY